MELPSEPLSALLAKARRRNGEYRTPTADELKATRAAADQLLDAISHAAPLDAAAAALARLHLTLVKTTLEGAPALAVVEEPGHRQGRGLYVFRNGATGAELGAALVIQVPHSFFDEDTLAIGLALSARARALFVNTVHRYPGGVLPAGGVDDEEAGDPAAGSPGPASPADLAHQTESVWQVMTASALQHLPGLTVVQVHGFADRPAAAPFDADMVVSPSIVRAGKAEAGAQVTRLRAALPGARVALYPRDARVLGGTTNAQARLLAKQPQAVFLHLEIARSLRRKLATNAALRADFVKAVWSGSHE